MDNKTKQITQQIGSLDNAKEWGKLVNDLSHLLCTKIATLRLKEVWLQKFTSSLLEERETIRKGGSITNPAAYLPAEVEQMINLSQQLMPVMELLKEVNDYIHEIHSNPKQLISLRELIYSSIDAYPFFESKQRSLIQIKINLDYKCRLSPVIAERMLNHLLETGLNSIINQQELGTINIWLSEENDQVALHYRVTGLELTQIQLDHIFDRFIFMDNSNNVRFGVGFFRLAMRHQGNDILCESVPNEYTHFTVLFSQALREPPGYH